MRKFLKIAGIIFFGLLMLIGIPGYYFVKNFDLNKYKSYASQIVEEQLGRKFAIKGEASIGISLVPTLILEDVELENAPWASNPQMVTVNKLELKFALMPLFKKQIVVNKAVLVNPQVYLETSKTGEANWDFPALKKTAAIEYQSSGWLIKSAQAQSLSDDKVDLSAFSGFAAESVVIENGLVNYKDQKDGSQTNVVINNMTLEAPGIEAPINASFDVLYNGEVIKGKSELGSIANLLDKQKSYPLMIDGTAYGVSIEMSGSLADLTGDLRYAFDTNLYNPAGNMDAPETTLKALVEGDMKNVDVTINLLNVVNNVITGKVNADISKKIPFINAALKSSKINLLSLRKNSPTAYNIHSFKFISTANAANFVPATPIPYKELKGINARADIQIGDLIIADGVEAKNVLLKANLNGGILNVNQLRLDFGGGEIDMKAAVNANTQSLNVNATSKNILLQNLHKEFAVTDKGDFGILSGGNTDLSINVSGKGATYRQVVESLKGQVIVILNQSVVQTGRLSFMTGNFITEVLNTIQFKSKKMTDLKLKCAVLRTDLVDGRAIFPKGIAISSKQMSLVSDGSINLINDKLDFTIHPFSGKVVDTNMAQALTSFFKVKGTIENPKIVLDDKEAIKAFVGIAATGGTAYLGSKLLLEPDASPCYAALLNTPYQNKFPKPTGAVAATQDVYKDTTKTIESDFKALKDSAKGFLKAFKKKEGGS